jgi:hypothetical protein
LLLYRPANFSLFGKDLIGAVFLSQLEVNKKAWYSELAIPGTMDFPADAVHSP